MLLHNLMKRLDEQKERIIEIRRYLHEHPELSFQEEQTAKYILDFYNDVPVDSVETNFGGERLKGRNQEKQLRFVLISMPYRFRKKPVCLSHQKMKGSCMHAVMTVIQPIC